MKGSVEKGRTEPIGSEHAVNHVLWARQTTGEQDCQNRVDVKALTGRGTLAHLRQQVATLDAAVLEMRELAEKSKSVIGLRAYLVVHQRSHSGYMFLRWRERSSSRHLPWDEAEKLDHGAPLLNDWCRAASRLAQEINARHLAARESIKRIRDDVEQSEPFMFPRSPISA
ncbi:hypothetical protein AVME950_00565 [Acidovorax sp. SUPP950]|uniref:hypothetical protein n=1 Tax=Acidovorax sp. SUPP950 TaxID=511901 RepID=UPI0023BF58AC|nr:hypothetical protein [Acidovorax sp. SUPP950]GKS73331.1 hypothetical protein AVME950_00565 [Acidovorax sp. SUPP950]